MADSIEPISIDDCDGSGLPQAEIDALRAGGPVAAERIVYPYENTVFPRGLLAPALMWEGPPADQVLVHIKSTNFEYYGCLTPTGNQVTIPQEVWKQAGSRTLGVTDPYLVELSPRANGAVAGPMAMNIKIAQATIKGSIYYNTYSANGIPGNGQILRIPAGGVAEPFVSNECAGCHSVSANGERMVGQTLAAGGRAYTLSADVAANPPSMPAPAKAAYAALYPDGSHYLTTYATVSSDVARTFITGPTANANAQVFNTDSGNLVPSTGIPQTAMMPHFSPDGTRLAFSDQTVGNGRALVLMDYDVNTHSATRPRTLHQETTFRVGWPFVLPDNEGVVFTATDGGDFSGNGAGFAGGLITGPLGDLFVADADGGSSVLLAQAMGFATPADAATDNTYLPYGATELHHNYFPTVSPVAAGGFFWVFFDSVRAYGNLGVQRQLWGAALTISASGDYTTDPSHPAFYVPGQEFGTGNHRAFAALDACLKDGNECTSGVDCCGGFCFFPDEVSEFDEPVGTCTSDVPTCSATNERCETDSDCCPPTGDEKQNFCIAGFCAPINIL